jgi:hypothetical protein
MESLSPTNAEQGTALLEAATANRETARLLLEELQLVEAWEMFGAVELAGSFRWNLMLGSDIDLNVINPACDIHLALSAMNRFVTEGRFLRFGFIDSVRGKPGWADPTSYPTGYFIGMAGDFHGREWKVEAWLLRAAPEPSNWIETQMTAECRLAILNLKQDRNAGLWKASSFDIYRAVLLGRARTISQANDWLHATRPLSP